MKKNLKEYIDRIDSKIKKEDSVTLVKIMEEESGYKAVLHEKIIGFGLYHYKYESGREGDAIVVGFLPKKQGFSIYIMTGFSKYEKELKKIGKHKKSSKCCLYINNVSDINENVLREIIRDSVGEMKIKYECIDA